MNDQETRTYEGSKTPIATNPANPKKSPAFAMSKPILLVLMAAVVLLLTCAVGSAGYAAWMHWDWPSRMESVKKEAVAKERLVQIEKEKAMKAGMEKEYEKRTQETAELLAPTLAETLVTGRMPSHLEEKWLGLMEIKDNQATRAPHRQAGIKSKAGLIGFPKDTLFLVHGYVIENKIGVGIASTVIEGNRYYISFHWLPGAGGTPTNLKEFRIIQGKKIQITKSG